MGLISRHRHWAVVKGEMLSVGMLLEAKAECLAINKTGITPLHFAAEVKLNNSRTSS